MTRTFAQDLIDMDVMFIRLPCATNDAIVATYALQAISRHEAGRPVIEERAPATCCMVRIFPNSHPISYVKLTLSAKVID